jgi:hypothetical protein
MCIVLHKIFCPILAVICIHIDTNIDECQCNTDQFMIYRTQILQKIMSILFCTSLNRILHIMLYIILRAILQ